MALVYGLAFSLLTALVVIAGDTFIKFAADSGRLASPAMITGTVLYAASAVMWFFAMRHVTLGQAAVAYSMLTLVALVAIGAVLFGEKVGLRETIGVGLALAAMALMTAPEPG